MEGKMQRTHSSGQMSVKASVWPLPVTQAGTTHFSKPDLLEAELPAVCGAAGQQWGWGRGWGGGHPEGRSPAATVRRGQRVRGHGQGVPIGLAAISSIRAEMR